DSTGTASTSYTLPTKPESVSITATASAYSPASLTVTALAGPPTTIGLVSGGAQSGTVATQLPAPIVVRLLDTYGNDVPGVPVQFSDNGGGIFSANPVLTGSNGEATVYYTLPTVAKVLSLSATYSSLKVNFGETSVAGNPTTMKIGSGNNQSAPPNTQLPKPLVVLVSDQYGNPVSGVSVTFSDNGANGTFSATSVITVHGQASVNYTTGSQPGPITITASVPSVTPATFHQTVQ
ncbi:MAG: Ig-like domain-containing protein, partial [Candidatus Sulfotelmatobacter sp.]